MIDSSDDYPQLTNNGYVMLCNQDNVQNIQYLAQSPQSSIQPVYYKYGMQEYEEPIPLFFKTNKPKKLKLARRINQTLEATPIRGFKYSTQRNSPKQQRIKGFILSPHQGFVDQNVKIRKFKKQITPQGRQKSDFKFNLEQHQPVKIQRNQDQELIKDTRNTTPQPYKRVQSASGHRHGDILTLQKQIDSQRALLEQKDQEISLLLQVKQEQNQTDNNSDVISMMNQTISNLQKNLITKDHELVKYQVLVRELNENVIQLKRDYKNLQFKYVENQNFQSQQVGKLWGDIHQMNLKDSSVEKISILKKDYNQRQDSTRESKLLADMQIQLDQKEVQLRDARIQSKELANKLQMQPKQEQIVKQNSLRKEIKQQRENEINMFTKSYEAKIDDLNDRIDSIKESNALIINTNVNMLIQDIIMICQAKHIEKHQIAKLFEQYSPNESITIEQLGEILKLNLDFMTENAQKLSKYIISFDLNDGIPISNSKTINQILKILMHEMGQFKTYNDNDINIMKKEISNMKTRLNQEQIRERLIYFINEFGNITINDMRQGIEMLDLDISKDSKIVIIIELIRRSNYKTKLPVKWLIESIQYTQLQKKKTKFNDNVMILGEEEIKQEIKTKSIEGQMQQAEGQELLIEQIIRKKTTKKYKEDEKNKDNENIIESAQKGFVALASHLFKYKLSLRHLFKNNIYDGFKNGTEVEFLLETEFESILESQNIENIRREQIHNIKKVLGKSMYGDVIFLYSLNEIVSELGIKDKLPQKRNGLNFSILNNKCVRIMNRLIDLMKQKNISLRELFGGEIETLSLKTSKGQNNFDVIQSRKFFELLQQKGLKKGLSIYISLQKFLAISDKNQEHLMIKKIEKSIEEIKNNKIYNNIGLNKRWFDISTVSAEQLQLIKQMQKLTFDQIEGGNNLISDISLDEEDNDPSDFKFSTDEDNPRKGGSKQEKFRFEQLREKRLDLDLLNN